MGECLSCRARRIDVHVNAGNTVAADIIATTGNKNVKEFAFGVWHRKNSIC